MQRTIEGIGTVDIEKLVIECNAGFDIEKQKEIVGKLALILNKDLPMVPLWERYGNNPVLKDVRVSGWPPPDHWVWKQFTYNYNPVVVMLLTGLYIRPVGWTPQIGLNQTVAELSSTVNALQSDIEELSSTVSSLESQVSALSGAISGISSAAYAAIGLAIISLIVAIFAVTRGKREE